MKKFLALLGVTLLAGCQMPEYEDDMDMGMEEENTPPAEDVMMDDEAAGAPVVEVEPVIEETNDQGEPI